MRRRHLLPLLLLLIEEDEAVEGRTRLQKLLFLTQKRLEEQGDPIEWGYSFRPYDYGPFAKALYSDVDQLRRRGFVEEREQRFDDNVIQYDYVLTKSGREYINEKLEEESLTKLIETARDIKKNFNDIPLRRLIDHVYSEYPEYTENSIL